MIIFRQKQQCTESRKGAALIMVLLVIGLISTIVVAVLTVLQNYAETEASSAYEFDALILAQKGLAYASHESVKSGDPLLSFSSPEDGEAYEVKIESEASRVNINNVLQRKDKELLRALFINWGMDIDSAAAVVDGLVDWVDPDSNEELNGAENPYYVAIGQPNRPFNKRFSHLEELMLVRGFSQVAEIRPDWAEFMTLWSDERIDVYQARAELLIAATGADRETVDQFQQQVAGPDGEIGTTDDAEFADLTSALDALRVDPSPEIRDAISAKLQLGGRARRVTSVGTVANTQKQILAVVRFNGKQTVLVHSEEKTIYQEE